MATKITTDILESYLQCRYKSHLKLVGEQGMPSDYERLLQGARARVRRMATDKLLSQYGAREILRSLTVTPAVLKRGVPLVLDATVEDEGLAVRFDALQRAPGPSRLGDFHYFPVLFHDAERCSQVQRSLLELLWPDPGSAPGEGAWLWRPDARPELRGQPDHVAPTRWAGSASAPGAQGPPGGYATAADPQ